MPTDRFHRLEQLFAEALERPAAARADFVARACGADAALGTQVAALLTAAEQSDDFLFAPALDVFARQISREGWSVQPGDRIGAYTIERRLGAGGMGEVWRARDARLGRDVAIKLLLPHPSNAAERLNAFQREARAAGALNHPNVLTVHDVGEHRGAPYLVTECLEGASLRARLCSGALPIDAALDIALQVARGLGAAHARGIVHRDLKPENIFIAADGRVKILDFGLATLHDPLFARGVEAPPFIVAGTTGYMAPEQMRGEPVDARADIFALGVVVDEMLGGQHVPPALSRLLQRCLATSADDRFPAIEPVATALDALLRGRTGRRQTLFGLVRRPAVAITTLCVMLAIAAVGWRSFVVASRAQWARNVAAPEIQRLANHGEYGAAFLLARHALDAAPRDPHLGQLWLDVSVHAQINSDPPGADVAIAPYASPTGAWFFLGRTPLRDVRIPRTLVRVRVSKAGLQPIDASMSPPGASYRLHPADATPPGMVRVIGGPNPVRPGLISDLEDYWIDRFEITNRQFAAFVQQGGYTRREYWREPFVDRGRAVPWEAALDRFRDATGRPGPATWKSGTYREGEADFPVGGVSWYEAAAFAAFAGKALPTMHHWYRAAWMGRFANILAASNFSGAGPAAVGSYGGVGPFGTYDMAGNVKEWCSTATSTSRFLLGGAWDEPRYTFGDYDARDPFERAPDYGFRLVKYDRPLTAAVTAPVLIDEIRRDAGQRRPVSDEIFTVYRRLYAYDRMPLRAASESTEETDSATEHTIALDAAGGGEGMRVHLFLPKTGTPPYQTVVFFGAADAFRLSSSRDMSHAQMNFVVASGRAFVVPVYKGTYERGIPDDEGANAQRDLRIAWSKDLGRTIDYLETRSDIDRDRLGFYGVSAGADAGVILTALEPRLKASVLQGTGIWEEPPPEIAALNFAPRVRIPTLMLNGRYDFENPYETAQRPLFALLGSPADAKKHVVLESGHALPVDDASQAVLAWFDRYLGRVRR